MLTYCQLNFYVILHEKQTFQENVLEKIVREMPAISFMSHFADTN